MTMSKKTSNRARRRLAVPAARTPKEARQLSEDGRSLLDLERRTLESGGVVVFRKPGPITYEFVEKYLAEFPRALVDGALVLGKLPPGVTEL